MSNYTDDADGVRSWLTDNNLTDIADTLVNAGVNTMDELMNVTEGDKDDLAEEGLKKMKFKTLMRMIKKTKDELAAGQPLETKDDIGGGAVAKPDQIVHLLDGRGYVPLPTQDASYSAPVNLAALGNELDTMLEEVSKLYLIAKPEQSGKTLEMLLRIVAFHRGSDNSISIIFCDNSLLQVSQTKERAGKMDGLGKICEISSSPDAEMHNWRELHSSFCSNEGYTTITCCAHSTQIHGNIDEFLKIMEKTQGGVKFEIYFDEASKVAVSPKMEKRVREWERLSNVERICFIDATPESKEGGLLSVYADVKPLNLCVPKQNLSPDYVGVADFEHIELEPLHGENCVGYAKRILDTFPLKADDYAFIPAGFKKTSHNEMRDMLVEKKAVVVVLNGTEKGMSYCGDDGAITHKFGLKRIQTSSVNDIIDDEARSLAKELNRPLVITGGIVPGRGLSFQKPGMLFNRGIFGPNIAKNAKDRSQKYGRLKGNIRGFEGYVPCIVHSSKAFHDDCVVQEGTSRWLFEMAREGKEGDETKMDQATFHQELVRQTDIQTDREPVQEPIIKIFEGEAGQEEGREWFKDNLSEVFEKRGPNTRKKEGGMYYATIRTLGTRAYTTSEVYENRRWGLGTKGGYRFHPCYDDINDPTTLQWILVYYSV